jgi:hypothetical protein
MNGSECGVTQSEFQDWLERVRTHTGPDRTDGA